MKIFCITWRAKNIYGFRPKNKVKVVKRSKNIKNVIIGDILYKKVLGKRPKSHIVTSLVHPEGVMG